MTWKRRSKVHLLMFSIFAPNLPLRFAPVRDLYSTPLSLICSRCWAVYLEGVAMAAVRIFTFQRKRPRCCSCDAETTWNSSSEGRHNVWWLPPDSWKGRWRKVSQKSRSRVVKDAARHWTRRLKYNLSLRPGGDGDRWQRLQPITSWAVAAPSWGKCLEQH